jgi:hypothetical protein
MSAADGTRQPMLAPRPPKQPWGDRFDEWEDRNPTLALAAVTTTLLSLLVGVVGFVSTLAPPSPPPTMSVLCAHDPRRLDTAEVQRCTLYYLQTKTPVQIVDLPPLEILGDQCVEP